MTNANADFDLPDEAAESLSLAGPSGKPPHSR